MDSAQDTATLAGFFADHSASGDCYLLDGPVGAGKTHFARSFIQHLQAKSGVVEDVPSPTFTLVQTYDTDAGEVWHADLYRLSGLDEITELGLEDAFETAITLVEWPDRLGPLAPKRHVFLDFTGDDDPERRRLIATPQGDGWDWLAGAPFHE
ncbi:MAG TPA: tRNA (adenosine(37)-N6)-threonylcarbamoyltransferase complex ATPase subunit type 1 TsaE [Paracoccaceae bacterium]|nr:tRNA (adenosine(37)-N6)-threonylcarbamoyltransferase complex ATPase subunit type 1 TsaE [Paracoccaceae bacterium]